MMASLRFSGLGRRVGVLAFAGSFEVEARLVFVVLFMWVVEFCVQVRQYFL